MGNLNVIDRFTETFGRYIDSGFGLLDGEVAFLVTILVGIDIALAGLFWALGHESNIIGQLLKKVLYVGFFALLLNNFSILAGVVFASFAGLGLQATGGTIAAADLLRPGFVAGTGFEAAYPLLTAAQSLLGFTSVFNHAPTILILLFAWIVVVLSFFILAVQIFITLIEFKLTTLAGFVLVPFALWNKTTFLAERVLGNVIASGVKVMVLAVIVGIGSTVFGGIVTALPTGATTDAIDIEHTMSLVLAAIALLGLGVFGPGIASGLVSGAPQLGAGAAVGTAAGLAAGTVAGAGATIAGGRALASGAGSAVSSAASLAGGAHTAYGLARATSGASGAAGAAAGMAGIARAGAGAMASGASSAKHGAMGGLGAAYRHGQQAAFTATGGAGAGGGDSSHAAAGGNAMPDSAPDSAPDWARRMRSDQRLREAGHMAAQTVRDGDRPASAEAPQLRDSE